MRVVITGAAGRIGIQMVEELSEAYELRLIDRVRLPRRKSVVADLRLFQSSFRCYDLPSAPLFRFSRRDDCRVCSKND
jgi:nucleoside-diphosphate-sugar epimerase